MLVMMAPVLMVVLRALLVLVLPLVMWRLRQHCRAVPPLLRRAARAVPPWLH